MAHQRGTNYLLSGETPERRGNQHPNIVPYQVFEVADGNVIVAVGNDTHFVRFCELIGWPELAGDSRFATNAQRLRHREVLIPLLAERLTSMTKAEVIEGLEARGVPAGLHADSGGHRRARHRPRTVSIWRVVAILIGPLFCLPSATGHDDETPPSWLVCYNKCVATLEKSDTSRGDTFFVKHPDGLYSLRDDAPD